MSTVKSAAPLWCIGIPIKGGHYLNCSSIKYTRTDAIRELLNSNHFARANITTWKQAYALGYRAFKVKVELA